MGLLFERKVHGNGLPVNLTLSDGINDFSCFAEIARLYCKREERKVKNLLQFTNEGRSRRLSVRRDPGNPLPGKGMPGSDSKIPTVATKRL
jgi:hypothetical protein